MQAEPIENAGARLRLHQAASAEKECEFALWSVRRLLEGGCRCRELAVAYTDRAAYEPALRTLFARAGFRRISRAIMRFCGNRFFAALLAAMEAVERYDYEPVLTFLKSGLGTLEQDACDRLERYAYVWNIHGAQWEESWTMHPAGYGAAWDDRSRAELEQLEQWRAAAVAPLAELKRGWRTAQNVGQMLRRLDEFLDRITLADRIDAQAAELEQAGEAQSAQQTRQLYDILIGAMEQMDQVLGACVMQPQQFTDVFRILLGQYQVGSIPASVDQVQVGGIEAFRCPDAPSDRSWRGGGKAPGLCTGARHFYGRGAAAAACDGAESGPGAGRKSWIGSWVGSTRRSARRRKAVRSAAPERSRRSCLTGRGGFRRTAP